MHPTGMHSCEDVLLNSDVVYCEIPMLNFE